MLKRIALGLLLALPAIPALAQAHAPAFVARQVPDAALVGKAHFRYMMMDIYDAELFAPHGQYEPGKPVALRLTYLRHLNGEKIADRSAQEMRKEGFDDEVKLSAWYNQMRGIFPDVEDGMSLTGVMLANGTTEFYQDGKKVGQVDDAEFGPRFFGIWLDRRTSEPDMRAQLLNQAK